MGIVDLHRLKPIFEFLQYNYPQYDWELDSGDKETAVQILDDVEGTVFHPPEDWNGHIFVPDIYSDRFKIAIEYQEQPKPKKHRGRLSKKGHTEFSDEDKDTYYAHAGIYQIKIWDDNENWKEALNKQLEMK